MDSNKPDDGQTEASLESEDTRIGRRTYLKVAGGLGGLLSGGGLFMETVDRSTPSGGVAFGYGGPSVPLADAAVAAGSETEPNDERGEATPITVGSSVRGHLESGGVDWFVFSADADRTLYATLDRAVTTGVVALVAYAGDGHFNNQLYVGNESPGTVPIRTTQAGEYYVQVVDTENGAGDYVLELARDEPATTTTRTTTTTTETTTETETTTTTETTTSTATPTPQRPYPSAGGAIPGRVEAENFDTGGEGVAYHDTDSSSSGVYRDTGVDIQRRGDRYNIGWIDDGEWLEYTVNVASGTYDVRLNVAAPSSGGQVRVLLDGDALGTATVPDTGGWHSWTTVTLSDVTVEGGDDRVLRLEIVDGDFNFDWVEFVERPSATTTAAPTSTPSTTTTTADTTTATTTADTTTTTTTTDVPWDEFGEQGFGEYGFGGTK